MSRLRILVLDAYAEDGRAALRSAGATEAGVLYGRLLGRLAPEAEIEVRYPADGDTDETDADTLRTYAGVVWTGSSLTIHAAEDRAPGRPVLQGGAAGGDLRDVPRDGVHRGIQEDAAEDERLGFEPLKRVVELSDGAAGADQQEGLAPARSFALRDAGLLGEINRNRRGRSRQFSRTRKNTRRLAPWSRN